MIKYFTTIQSCIPVCTQCMCAYSVFVSLSHMHTHRNSFMFYSLLLLHESMQYRSTKILMCFCCLFFCLQYVAQIQYMADTSGYMVWLRPGSSNICTILVSVYLNLLIVPRGVGFTIDDNAIYSREFRQSQKTNTILLFL